MVDAPAGIAIQASFDPHQLTTPIPVEISSKYVIHRADQARASPELAHTCMRAAYQNQVICEIPVFIRWMIPRDCHVLINRQLPGLPGNQQNELSLTIPVQICRKSFQYTPPCRRGPQDQVPLEYGNLFPVVLQSLWPPIAV